MKKLPSCVKPPPDGYADRATIFRLVNKLRKNYGLRPYASAYCVAQLLQKGCCKRIFVRTTRSYFNIDDALSIAYMALEKQPALGVRASWKNCYVVAPDHCENSQEWNTVSECAKLIGTSVPRLNIAIKRGSIYAYYSERRKRRLINIEQAREWICWRSFSFIKKHLGFERTRKLSLNPNIKTKIIHWGGHHQKMYYVPELAHL